MQPLTILIKRQTVYIKYSTIQNFSISGNSLNIIIHGYPYITQHVPHVQNISQPNTNYYHSIIEQDTTKSGLETTAYTTFLLPNVMHGLNLILM